jgi:hypothetical protein
VTTYSNIVPCTTKQTPLTSPLFVVCFYVTTAATHFWPLSRHDLGSCSPPTATPSWPPRGVYSSLLLLPQELSEDDQDDDDDDEDDDDDDDVRGGDPSGPRGGGGGGGRLDGGMGDDDASDTDDDF